MRFADVIQLFENYALMGSLMLVPAVLIFLIGYFFIYKRLMKGEKRLQLLNVIIYCGFFCYVFIVMGATLLSRPVSGFSSRAPNLTLFSTYRQAWHWALVGEWRNLVMNIIMFIPIGLGLPKLSKKARHFLVVIGSGFLLTLFIEFTQLLTGRGGFSVDDLFNNTLGAVLGFCLFKLGDILLKERPLRFCHLIKWFSPLLITVGFFTGLFTIYHVQPFGMLPVTSVLKQDMSQLTVTSEVTFSEKSNQAPIFATSGLATREETHAFATHFFENIGAVMVEDETIPYDELVVYRGVSLETDATYSLWVNKLGLTFWYIDFEPLDLQRLIEVDEEIIREKLLDFNVQIPDQAEFIDLGNGDYQFTVKVTDDGNQTSWGTVELSFFEDYTIREITNNIVTAEACESVALLSEQTAFERLKQGWILPHFVSEYNTIHILSVELDWLMDSKGFLQPIYQFNVEADGRETFIKVPAKK